MLKKRRHLDDNIFVGSTPGKCSTYSTSHATRADNFPFSGYWALGSERPVDTLFPNSSSGCAAAVSAVSPPRVRRTAATGGGGDFEYRPRNSHLFRFANRLGMLIERHVLAHSRRTQAVAFNRARDEWRERIRIRIRLLVRDPGENCFECF